MKTPTALIIAAGLLFEAQAMAAYDKPANELQPVRGLYAQVFDSDTDRAPAADTEKSTAKAEEPSQSRTLKETYVGVSPQIGVIGYTDASGNYMARAAAGLGVDGNAGRLVLGSLGSLTMPSVYYEKTVR